MAQVMLAKNGLRANAGECYVTIDGNRYNMMNCKNIEINFEKNKTQFGILGRTNKANKAVSSAISGSAEFYLNQSIWREIAYKFQETGEDTYFDIQITNEDKTSDVGRQTIIVSGCNFDSITLAMLDADTDDILTESLEFTGEMFDMPEKFKEMAGVR